MASYTYHWDGGAILRIIARLRWLRMSDLIKKDGPEIEAFRWYLSYIKPDLGVLSTAAKGVTTLGLIKQLVPM